MIIFDIDGVVRDVGGSYRRALADTVEYFTEGNYRPNNQDIDRLKSEGIWNNDWEASQELVYRNYEKLGRLRDEINLDYGEIVNHFQRRYRGSDPVNWNGYICDEPLLMGKEYTENLTRHNIPWGFFSGATRGSANYILERRLGIDNPVLIAMEDAPGKPDPTGLFMAIDELKKKWAIDEVKSVIYVGDTIADIQTVINAQQRSTLEFIGLGISPPHVQNNPESKTEYSKTLINAGAVEVFDNIEKITPEIISILLDRQNRPN
jgi:HAD superfamily phosphatase